MATRRSRSWGWDMAEMKEAASLDERNPDDLESASLIWQPSPTGLTPINQQEPLPLESTSAIESSGTATQTAKPIVAKVRQPRKRNGSQSLGAAAVSKKPSKRACQVKSKAAGKKEDVKTQDISKAFSVVKSGLVDSKQFPEISSDGQSKPDTEFQIRSERADDTCSSSNINAEQMLPKHVGLGQAYQAAYAEPSRARIAEDGANPSPKDDHPNGDADSVQATPEPIEDYISFMRPGQFKPVERSTSADNVDRAFSLDSFRLRLKDDEFSRADFGTAASERLDFTLPYRSSSLPIEELDDQPSIELVADVAAHPQLEIARDDHLGAVEDSCSGHSSHVYDENDDFYLGIDEFLSNDVPSIDLSDDTFGLAQKDRPRDIHNRTTPIPEDPFADDDLDAQLVHLGTTPSKRNHGQSPPFTQRTPPVPKLQWMPPTPCTSPPKRLTAPSTPAIMIRPNTPVTNSSPLSERSPNVPAHVVPSKNGLPAPFVRPPFPKPLLPRSPIPGTSPNTVLRTCFRIGEALNAASVCLQNSTDAIIELYCQVKYSNRQANGHKQFFDFVDLFSPEKSPSLSGQYAIWKGIDLWEHDSRQFLGEGGRGKKARVIGRIKRGPKNQGWEMTILSIWKADWDDVGIAKGIVCSN